MRYYIKEEDIKDLDLDIDVGLVDRHGNEPVRSSFILVMGNYTFAICQDPERPYGWRRHT